MHADSLIRRPTIPHSNHGTNSGINVWVIWSGPGPAGKVSLGRVVAVEEGGVPQVFGVPAICLLPPPHPFCSLIKACGEACGTHRDSGWGCLLWSSGYFEAHLTEFEYLGAAVVGCCELISYMLDWISGSD